MRDLIQTLGIADLRLTIGREDASRSDFPIVNCQSSIVNSQSSTGNSSFPMPHCFQCGGGIPQIT